MFIAMRSGFQEGSWRPCAIRVVPTLYQSYIRQLGSLVPCATAPGEDLRSRRGLLPRFTTLREQDMQLSIVL